MKENVIVVLGGGSARGLAHIGVLETIEKNYNIQAIIGTSMGAIIGGLYASGLSPRRILQIAESIKVKEYLSFFKLNFTGGFVNSAKMLEFFDEKVGGLKIEQLPIKYASVAFDIKQKQTVLINRGYLASAMLASCSLPLIFHPYKYKDYLFCDGGVEYPLPVDFAHVFDKNLKIIAVNVLPPISHEPSFVNFETNNYEACKRNNLVLSLQVTILNQAFLATRSLLEHKPDYYISAYTSKLTSWDFIRAKEFYKIGIKSAKHHIEIDKSDSPLDELYDKLSELKDRIKKLKMF